MTHSYVVDASVAIKWMITEQGSQLADRLRGRGWSFAAPHLLMSECANIVWKKVRRGELSPEDAASIGRLLQLMDVELHDVTPMLERVISIANLLDHPSYDCEYLALAERLGVPFVTADAKLQAKASANGSPLPKVIHLTHLA